MAKDYDKIIKETLNDVIDVIMTTVLGINASRITRLETKMQITNEREADFIYEVEENGRIYIVHIEFQTTNDPDMPYRMFRYWIFIKDIHRKEVRQCLFYIGKEPLNMSNKIDDPKASSYDYEIIDFRNIDCNTFLDCNNPKAIVISILCDYKGKEDTVFTREILQRIKETVKEQTQRSKYIRQIEILSQLRDLQTVFCREVENMALVYDIEKDVRFQQGREKGLKEGIEEGIEKGIQQGREKWLKEGLQQGREKWLKEGLIEGIEALLEVKYSTDGIMLMDKVRMLKTIDELEVLKNLIKSSTSIERIKEHLNKE
ncbi:Transposase (putative), YhgA-like protein [Candidatus Magnetoovum chiemensis]|nr:Transposase (putative), YhgA-like protein [Candidatus Magnetoovum chiemensis]